MITLERHPWNTGFEWTFTHGPKQLLTPAQATQFDTEGYVVLEGAFAADEVAEVASELDAIDAQVEQFLRSQEGERMMIAEAGAITFAPHAVVRSKRLRRFVGHPIFTALCADIVGPDANLYWDQGVYKKPEKPRRFPWHQDNGYTFIEPQQYLTVWLALTDATVDNGCPWVAPRVHRLGTLARRGFGPEQVAALRPGIVYVSENCYGHVGPWAERPGWEQLGQTWSARIMEIFHSTVWIDAPPCGWGIE